MEANVRREGGREGWKECILCDVFGSIPETEEDENIRRPESKWLWVEERMEAVLI